MKKSLTYLFYISLFCTPSYVCAMDNSICAEIEHLERSILHDTLQSHPYDSEALMKDIKEQTRELFKIAESNDDMNHITCNDKSIFEIKEEFNDIYTWSSVGHFFYEVRSVEETIDEAAFSYEPIDDNYYSSHLSYKKHNVFLSLNYSKSCPKLSLDNDATLSNALDSYISMKGKDNFVYINFNNYGFGCERKIIIKTSSIKTNQSYEEVFIEFVKFHKRKYKK